MKIFFKLIGCCICLQVIVQKIYAQTAEASSKISLSGMASIEFIKTDSGLIMKRVLINSCKSPNYETSFIPQFITAKTIPGASGKNIVGQPKFIAVHGNIEYDFFYRSKTDNPFSQINLQQHTEKVNLEIMLKEKFPLQASFSLRQSNAPFFKNFADINLHFDPSGYRKNIKQQLIDKLSKTLSNAADIKSIETLLAEKVKQVTQLKDWAQSPATLQKIIEERELQQRLQQKVQSPTVPFVIPGIETYFSKGLKNNFPSVPKIKSKNADSSKKSFILYFNSKEKEIDSLLKNIEDLSKRKDSLKNAAQKNIAAVNQQIYKARDTKELMQVASNNRLDLSKDEKFSKALGSIRSFSLGRSMVNYTELTAKDIAITGVNLELNPSYYVAFAAGKINYQFRDFYNKNVKTSGQYLLLARIGTGNPERRALILTVFKGQKNAPENTVNNNNNNNNNSTDQHWYNWLFP